MATCSPPSVGARCMIAARDGALQCLWSWFLTRTRAAIVHGARALAQNHLRIQPARECRAIGGFGDFQIFESGYVRQNSRRLHITDRCGIGILPRFAPNRRRSGGTLIAATSSV